MYYTFAVAGKGGTGKTTLAGLLVETLRARGEGPVLAVDADPNANLNAALGMEVRQTIGDLREGTLRKIHDLPAGMPKDVYLEYGLHECLVEGDGVDLLVMGRGEGPRCYCAVNHVLRKYLDVLLRNYRYVVLDNEAGMEHLSRRTTQDVDALLVVSLPNPVALQAAARISALVDELDLRVKERWLILNNVGEKLPPAAQRAVEAVGLPLLGEIPADPALLELSWAGRPLKELAGEAASRRAVEGMVARLVGARAGTDTGAGAEVSTATATPTGAETTEGAKEGAKG